MEKRLRHNPSGILFPTGSFYPAQTGGPDNTVYWLTRALNSRGIQPTIVTSNDGITIGKVPFGKWLSTDYGRVIYFPERIHYLPLRLIATALREIRKADIVHLNNLFYPPSWISAAWAVWMGKPIVWSPRGELAPEALAFSTWKKKPVLWGIRKWLSSRVLFHATSRQEADDIRKNFGGQTRVELLPNYFMLPPKMDLSPEPYFLFLGRIHPIKGIDRLLKAAALSQKFRTSGFHLKIAGDDKNNYGNQLKQLVRQLDLDEKVEFIGYVEGEAKQRLLAQAYFAFLPSHTENFGITVIEALGQGTPVVASQKTPWQLLETRRAGYWVENVPAHMAGIIDRIIDLPEKTYQAMRRNACQSAREEFDIYKNVEHWLDLYKRLFNE